MMGLIYFNKDFAPNISNIYRLSLWKDFSEAFYENGLGFLGQNDWQPLIRLNRRLQYNWLF